MYTYNRIFPLTWVVHVVDCRQRPSYIVKYILTPALSSNKVYIIYYRYEYKDNYLKEHSFSRCRWSIGMYLRAPYRNLRDFEHL